MQVVMVGKRWPCGGVQAVVPIKFRTAKQLVSHNIHTSNYNYKYTFSVEIVPVCKVGPSLLRFSRAELQPGEYFCKWLRDFDCRFHWVPGDDSFFQCPIAVGHPLTTHQTQLKARK